MAWTQTYHSVGGTHTVTRAYDPEDLSSAPCVNSIAWGQGRSVRWETINYSDLNGHIPASESSSRVSRCYTDPSQDEVWNFAEYMANPFISLPQDVSEIDPSWSTCVGIEIGAMDPPRPLRPRIVMVPDIAPADPAQPTEPASKMTIAATPGVSVPSLVPTSTAMPLPSPDSPPSVSVVASNSGNTPQSDSSQQAQDPPVDNLRPSAANAAAILVTNSPLADEPSADKPTVSVSAPAPTPSPGPNPENDPSGLQFGTGVQNADPNEMSPAQMSQLDQALAPVASPAAANPANVPGSSSPQNSVAGIGGDLGPETQSNTNPMMNQGTVAVDSQPADVQLQPISSAIFNSPGPSVSNRQQNDALANGSAGSGGVDSGSIGNGASDGVGVGNDGSSNEGARSSGSDDGTDGAGGFGNQGYANNGLNKGGSDIGVSGSESSSNPLVNNAAQVNAPQDYQISSAAPDGTQPGTTNLPAIARAPNDGLVVGGNTIAPGQSATVNGHAIAVASSNVVVDGNTYAFAPTIASTATPITIGGLSIKPASNGGAVIGDSTFSPGDTTTTAGHVISVDSDNVVIDGSTQTFPSPTPVGAPAIIVEGLQVQPASDGAVLVGSSTLAAGAQTTVDGHLISVGADNVVIDGTTNALPTPTAGAPIVIGAISIQAAPSGGLILGSSTLTPWSQSNIAGHVISVGVGDVVVDGITSNLPIPSMSSPILIGAFPMQREPDGDLVVGSSTLVIGSQTTMAGHVISVGANDVIVDGVTNPLPTFTNGPSAILIGGQFIQRAPGGGLIMGSATLAPGSQTTMAGHLISVGANDVVLDGSTYNLPSTAVSAVLSSQPKISAITLPNGAILSAGGTPITISGQVISVFSDDKAAVIGGTTLTFAPSPLQSVFTVAGQTFTAAQTGFVVAGTTVALNGPAATISGTLVSLGTSGLQIGSSTMPLTSTTPSGLAGLIATAFDAPAATGPAPNQDKPASKSGTHPVKGSGARTRSGTCKMGATAGVFLAIGWITFPI